MATLTPLVCPSCSAPLDAIPPSGVVRCRYCGSRSQVRGPAAQPRLEVARAPVAQWIAFALLLATGAAIAYFQRMRARGTAADAPAVAVVPVAPLAAAPVVAAVAPTPPVPEETPPAPAVARALTPSPSSSPRPAPLRALDYARARDVLDGAKAKAERACPSTSGTKVTLMVWATLEPSGRVTATTQDVPWRGSPEMTCALAVFAALRVTPFRGEPRTESRTLHLK